MAFRERIGFLAMCEIFGTGLLKQSFQENFSWLCGGKKEYVATCASVNGFE